MPGAWLMVTSSQAEGRKPSSLRVRVQASNPSLQAPGSGNLNKVESAQAPGNRLQGHKYFFCASYERISGAGRTALSWVLMEESTLIQE